MGAVESITIIDAHGKPTPYTMDLLPLPDAVQVQISGDFAGRNVEEEVPLAELQRLVDEDGYDYRDLLGLTLTTEGHVVRGLIGIGSGNERFSISRADLAKAVTALAGA
jgi:hypothetical protein